MEHFLLSTHLTQAQGPPIGHLGPRGPLSGPPNNNIYFQGLFATIGHCMNIVLPQNFWYNRLRFFMNTSILGTEPRKRSQRQLVIWKKLIMISFSRAVGRKKDFPYFRLGRFEEKTRPSPRKVAIFREFSWIYSNFQTDPHTDGRTDRRTDLRTKPLIELLFATKKYIIVMYFQYIPPSSDLPRLSGRKSSTSQHHSFIHSFIRSFIHSFTHSFIYSSIYSFVHPFFYSFVHSFIYSFVQ